ncbi:VOC family protein [Gammaproteobacteria bacterium LSUCC0057]|uniref:VOC family protein n=1 Tax=Gammaproteobacteria bacterium LSUCC0057 TaxID=2559237 RepID=A0A4Y8UNN4_9GAMM|nr:VOC family protein [Gammaproteobacteria bacterium LSUCC0057]
MLGYVTLGSNDLARATAFYDKLSAEFGGKRLLELPEGKGVFYGRSMAEAGLLIRTPFNEQPATVGNGVMAALAATDTAMVDRVHAAALALGATDEGAPGQRTDFFYGAYFRDLDGNKLAVYVFI